MSQNTQFISVRETAQILGISEKKVMDLIEGRKLQAYRIADKFLRLKKTDVLGLRNSGVIRKENVTFSYSGGEKLGDFLYFYDFYIISGLIIAGLLYVIFYT
jgi:excisionase family DNA binding protein